MRHVSLDESGLAGQSHQLRVVTTRQHRLRVGGDVGEGGFEIEVLEGATPFDLRRDLTGDGQDRRSVDLGVV